MKKLCNNIILFFKSLFSNSLISKADIIYEESPEWLPIETIIILKINEYRYEEGVTPLTRHHYLKNETNIRVKYLVATNKLSHDKFFESSKRLKKKGFTSISENLAFGYKSASDIVEAWKKSPSHNKAMLKNYSDAAVSHLKGNNGYFTCLIFAKS